MQRRSFLARAAWFAAAPLMPRRVSAAEPGKLTMLRGGIGYFTEKGGTIGFQVTRHRVHVVDAEFPEQAARFLAALDAQYRKPVGFLFNTHHHTDHTAGNIAFRGKAEHVVAHVNSLANQRRVAHDNFTDDQQLFPDTVFDAAWRFREQHDPVRAYYFGPAHTNGDAVFHFEGADVAHLGDLVFNGRWAVIDPSAGGTVRGWIDVLDKVLATFPAGTQFIFGHAAEPASVSGDRSAVQAMRDYLARATELVARQVKAGLSREQVQQITTIPGVTGRRGEGIEKVLAAAYDEFVEAIR